MYIIPVNYSFVVYLASWIMKSTYVRDSIEEYGFSVKEMILGWTKQKEEYAIQAYISCFHPHAWEKSAPIRTSRAFWPYDHK